MPTRPRHRRRRAFTLIEVLIVVVLMAILAAAILPRFQDHREHTLQVVFATDVRVFADAARRYLLDTGELPEDSGTGFTPAGWEDYIDVDAWESLTPIGGAWDFEKDSFGIGSAFGVDFANAGGEDRDAAFMAEVDALLDDGDVSTGRFRMISAGRYYYVLKEDNS